MEINNDQINRRAAIKWCRPEDWGTPDERWRPESEYGAMIKALPPAQAERKKAVWRHEPRKKSWIFYCSACGATAYWPQNNRTDTPARCQYKICPSCGAEMEASE